MDEYLNSDSDERYITHTYATDYYANIWNVYSPHFNITFPYGCTLVRSDEQPDGDGGLPIPDGFDPTVPHELHIPRPIDWPDHPTAILPDRDNKYDSWRAVADAYNAPDTNIPDPPHIVAYIEGDD